MKLKYKKMYISLLSLALGLMSVVLANPASAVITSDISVTQNPDKSVTFSWDGSTDAYTEDEFQNGNVLHICPASVDECFVSGEFRLTYYIFMDDGLTSITLQVGDLDSGSGRIEAGRYVAQMVNWADDSEFAVGPLVPFTIGTISETEFPIVANGYRADNLGSVYFAPGSSKLSKAAQDQIKAMVTANPSAIYKVTGYVQKSATKVNDARISLARARAVETYLKSLGAGVNFTVVIETGLVPNKDGNTSKARKATLFAMTPVVL